MTGMFTHPQKSTRIRDIRKWTRVRPSLWWRATTDVARGETTMLTAHRKLGEADFAIEREWIRSPPEAVKDDSWSTPLGLDADAGGFGQARAAHSLLNSMPCAYTWFYH